MTQWDYVTDFLVVGSGAGMAGAVAASLVGLDALVIEKTECIGGSTGMSGGILWLPNNPLMQREGVPDSLQAALEYFATVVGDAGPGSSDARRRAYVTAGIEMIDALEREGMKFVRCEGYSDYRAEEPGVAGASVRGRSIECVPTDRKRIGPLADKLRPWLTAPAAAKTGELAPLSLLRSRRGVSLAAKVGFRTALGRVRNQRLATNGGALITQLVEVLLRREVPIWTEAPFVELITQDGRVVGATVRRHDREVRVLARRGVLISSGGFAHNASMRRKYSADQPNEAKWSLSNPGDTGEVLQALIDQGAAIGQMDEAWWNPCAFGPDGKVITIAMERMRPHSIMVDASGQRFFNESTDYVRTGQAMYRREAETGGGVPTWLIVDSNHRSHYTFGLMPPGRTSKDWIQGGYLKRSDTIAGLAEQCGLDPATLTATVERFNPFAKAGVDEDFHRGVGAHERYYGDSTHKPNPCLGPVEKPPFYAIEVYPGDVGTCGGVVCNEHAQVLTVDGEVIPGLYAAGNVTASIAGRTYPGAGASIAASAVFSYIAANHAASRTPVGAAAE